MLVSALIRRVGLEGGNAVIVAKGDATSGSIMLICMDKGVRTSFRERLLGSGETYEWAVVGPGPEASEDAVATWLERRRLRDPDLWIVELDIPNAQRFAAETSGDG